MATISWRTEWNAIAARIDGIVRAGEFFYRSIEKRTEDSYGALKKILLPQSSQAYVLLVEYNQKYAGALPTQAADSLNQFVTDFKSVFEETINSGTLNHCLPFLQIRLTALSAFRSQLEFCLSNLEDQIRVTTDRAMFHLQRCIVADIRYREQWKLAYQEGEPSCEKLGAVHLLWHGIWAFKANASGGRTDLVMGNRIDNPSKVEETALGMALTEWKRATSEGDVQKKYDEGIIQASHYSAGVLGGVELTSVRYIVVVTTDIVRECDEVVKGNITYKFFNIAVDPSAPSETARKKSITRA